jgi:hypothetical protein
MLNDHIDLNTVQDRLAECRTLLEDLKSGRVMTGVIGSLGWRHTTQQDIERKKKEVARYERLLAHGPGQQ